MSTFKIVRTRNADIFAGTLKKLEGNTATMTKARRLWYWKGAASLSQLVQTGTSKPSECKFPMAVDLVVLFEVIEVLDVTKNARKSIDSVPVWSA